jgi:hypothetical protein
MPTLPLTRNVSIRSVGLDFNVFSFSVLAFSLYFLAILHLKVAKWQGHKTQYNYFANN